MKKIFILAGVLLLSLLFITNVSANVVPTINATIIGGVIYQGDYTNGVEGATVGITCYHGNEINYKETISSVNGIYNVIFYEEDCSFGDNVNVVASYSSLSGTNDGTVWLADDKVVGILELDIGMANVPMVPEFGFVMGMLTILSAVGVFFVVRKE